MLITYFDEVKPDAERQPYYWLGGLMIAHEILGPIDAEVRALAEQCFGSGALTEETEFHATDICSGAKNFKTWRDLGARLDVLKSLVRIVDKPKGVYRVTVRLDVARIEARLTPESITFMYFVERVNNFAKRQKRKALLIGDLEHKKGVNRAVNSLTRYRENGTEYEYGQEIAHIVDTVHFAASHHSRLLQLADAYMWTRQLVHRRDAPGRMRTALLEFLSKETDIGWAHTYKNWPPERA